jgi:hypothetical protein
VVGDACALTSECAGGHVCAGQVCLRVNEQPCVDADDCASGSCVENQCSEADTGERCQEDADCRGGHVCQAGVCVRPLGEACATPDQCGSGRCVDGVCCESDCDGACDLGCDPSGRCLFAADGIPCQDGDDCTHGDRCTAAVCVADRDLTCAGSLPFVDATEAAGLAGVANQAGEHGGAYAIAWGDHDGDGWLDLFLGGAGPPGPDGAPLHHGLLYRNRGDGAFDRVEPAPEGRRAGAWGDPDNDGDLDLFTSVGLYEDEVLTSASRLWINDGEGGFAMAEDEIGLGGADNLGTGAWLDADADGWLDLFYPNGNDDPNQPGAELRINLGTETLAFTTYTDAGLEAGHSNGETCAVADVDNDGDVDIWYNDADDGSLFLNDGSGGMVEASAAAGLAIAMGAAPEREQPYYAPVFGDYNNDGLLDLFLGHPQGIANRLYTNTTSAAGSPPSFVLEVTPALLAEDLGHSRGAAWGDYDNDGDLDLLVGNEADDADGDANAAAPNALYENRGAEGFVDVAALLGLDDAGLATRTTSVSFADYDEDGDLDVYFANPGGANRLWNNPLDDDKYLKVVVRGRGGGYSPRDGVGTRVELWDAGAAHLLAVREVSGGEGYGSQPPSVQHFGLAAAWGGGQSTYTVRARFTSGAVVERAGVVPVKSTAVIGGQLRLNTLVLEE